MANANAESSEAGRARLRTLIGTIDRKLSRLPQSTIEEGPDNLNMCFAELVTLLALGPAPEVRECPVCKHSGRREATRCGHCWTKLSPPQPISVGEVS